jgi:hypothetical protein
VHFLVSLLPANTRFCFSADAAASPLLLEARHRSAARSAAGDLR